MNNTPIHIYWNSYPDVVLGTLQFNPKEFEDGHQSLISELSKEQVDNMAKSLRVDMKEWGDSQNMTLEDKAKKLGLSLTSEPIFLSKKAWASTDCSSLTDTKRLMCMITKTAPKNIDSLILKSVRNFKKRETIMLVTSDVTLRRPIHFSILKFREAMKALTPKKQKLLFFRFGLPENASGNDLIKHILFTKQIVVSLSEYEKIKTTRDIVRELSATASKKPTTLEDKLAFATQAYQSARIYAMAKAELEKKGGP
jgi:hypothetical protein